MLAEQITEKSSKKVLNNMFEHISEKQMDSNMRFFETMY